MNPNSIKQLIQSIAEEGAPRIIKGIITSTNPLQACPDNDLESLIPESAIIVPTELYPLTRGEIVYMLSVNHGKIYFALSKM